MEILTRKRTTPERGTASVMRSYGTQGLARLML
jgi:hypothetical protein